MQFKMENNENNFIKEIESKKKNDIELSKQSNNEEFKSQIEKFKKNNKHREGFNYFMNIYKDIDSSVEYSEIDELLRNTVKEKLKSVIISYNNKNEELDLKMLADELYNGISIKFKEKNLKLKNYLPSVPLWRKILQFGFKISDRKIFSQECQIYDNSDWMSHLDNSQKIGKILIPGSHDSGSCYMCPIYETDVLGKLAATQKATIKEQLQSGIRAFDWRMKNRKSCLMFNHGPITGGNVLSDTKDLCNFLHNHKDEIVIMKIKGDEKSVENFFESKIVKDELLPMVLDASSIKEKKLEDLTLSEIKSGHNSGLLIILLDDNLASNHKMCFPISSIYSHYNKKTRTSENNATMINSEVDSLEEIKEQDLLKSCTPLNTSSAGKVIRHSLRSIVFMPESETSTYPLINVPKNLKNNVNKLLSEIDQKNIRLNCINLDGVGTPEAQECINSIIARNDLPEAYKADLINSTNKG